ncbi:MAG: 16S rRNA (cytidine(1402)-2'-O)-methyltransferase [Butyrivibrio sp.]|nr:16S rRNA (cytidine(1402)-2'-O)-methyltransferase [Butyrivibrio sp.]
MAVGKLYLCATPIGNLEDMPVRAVRLMREADLIAAEDTRNSIKLLNHFEIKTPMTSYHEYNKADKAAVLVDKMLAGQTVALITDAGTPGISDPGEELVRRAAEARIEVIPVPGPAACINALIVSGLSTRRFAFEAFLPADKKERREVFEELKRETRTMIIYEAPHRLLKTLEELKELLGGERRVAVCKELTKKHETVYRATLSEAARYYADNEPRGEYVLVLEGLDRRELARQEREVWQEMSVEEHLALYVNRGIERREAVRLVAKDRGVPKREIYNMTV